MTIFAGELTLFLLVNSFLWCWWTSHIHVVPRWIRSSLRWCWPRVMPLAASQTLARFQRVVLKSGSQFQLINVVKTIMTIPIITILMAGINHQTWGGLLLFNPHYQIIIIVPNKCIGYNYRYSNCWVVGPPPAIACGFVTAFLLSSVEIDSFSLNLRHVTMGWGVHLALCLFVCLSACRYVCFVCMPVCTHGCVDDTHDTCVFLINACMHVRNCGTLNPSQSRDQV